MRDDVYDKLNTMVLDKLTQLHQRTQEFQTQAQFLRVLSHPIERYCSAYSNVSSHAHVENVETLASFRDSLMNFYRQSLNNMQDFQRTLDNKHQSLAFQESQAHQAYQAAQDYYETAKDDLQSCEASGYYTTDEDGYDYYVEPDCSWEYDRMSAAEEEIGVSREKLEHLNNLLNAMTSLCDKSAHSNAQFQSSVLDPLNRAVQKLGVLLGHLTDYERMKVNLAEAYHKTVQEESSKSFSEKTEPKREFLDRFSEKLEKRKAIISSISEDIKTELQEIVANYTTWKTNIDLSKVEKIGDRFPINTQNYSGAAFTFDINQNVPYAKKILSKINTGDIKGAKANLQQMADLFVKYPKGVEFSDAGYPDFSPYIHIFDDSEIGLNSTEITKKNIVEIEQIQNYNDDFDEADKSANIDDNYRQIHKLTWHHVEDGKTLMLIPRDIHNMVRHAGGVAVTKNSYV